MPRPGPRRPVVAVRVDPDHANWLRVEADRLATSQGYIIRELITRAMKRKPSKVR